jgi:glycosyltransferase involved in cell wall biosynthesis
MKRWLIVEDALRDRKGHWFEYVQTFKRGLEELGDEVTILVDKEAEPFIRRQLAARACLPASIWHRISDGSGAIKRYARIPLHAFLTWRCLRRVVSEEADYDVIFVPTVLVHHLLGWVWLIHGPLRKKRTRVLLFFPSLPLNLSADGATTWDGSPTSRLLAWLLSTLKGALDGGRVIIGVETGAMQDALQRLSRLPVTYFPHPVEPFRLDLRHRESGPLMACYGPARHEKGSEFLQEALSIYLRDYPSDTAKFSIQWLDDFRNAEGEWVKRNEELTHTGRLEFIRNYFADGEYARYLEKTDVLLLPYRGAGSAYSLRVSRVLIEGLVNGLPAIVTARSTLAQQLRDFGAGLAVEERDIAAYVEALHEMSVHWRDYRARAEERMLAARSHFSVAEFRRCLSQEPIDRTIALSAPTKTRPL